MGVRLVAWALTTSIKGPSRLREARARIVLVAMAQQAVDKHPAPWWSGGAGGALYLADILRTHRRSDVSEAMTLLADNDLIERTYKTSTGDPLSRNRPARWILKRP